jgi:hypothetical protein
MTPHITPLLALVRPVLSIAGASLLLIAACHANPGDTTPSPAPASGKGNADSSPVNTVDTVISDMSLLNDMALAGVPSGPGWATGPGHVVMGNDPRGSRTPDWWTPANRRYKSKDYWTTVLPWFVVFDGVGHDASNTRVQIRNLKVFVKRRSDGQWTLVGASTQVSGELYPKHLQGDATRKPDERREPDGSTSVKAPGGNLAYHGWCCGKLAIDAPDVAAVFVTLQARLVPDHADQPDDRQQARLLIQMGADYYPDRNTPVSAFAPASYNPGVGVSRAKRVTETWRAFNFATLDVGVQDPGGAAISVAEFRSAPPPLE